MTNNKFNLRNVVAIAICLAGSMIFVGCGGRSSEIITMTTNKSGKVEIYLSSLTQEVVIDWGDGTTQGETMPLLSDYSSFEGKFEHSYSSTTPRTITITSRGVYYLRCNDNQLMSLDVSRCTHLKSLVCRENQLTSLDVSEHFFLREIDCSFNQLTSLDVRNSPLLKKVNCSINQLTEDALRAFIESWNHIDISDESESVQISFIGNPGSTDKIIEEIKSRGFQIVLY